MLEIGAGTGYNAALIAHVVGPDQRDDHRRRSARPRRGLGPFAALSGSARLRLKHADGRLGYPAACPVRPHHRHGGDARPGAGLAGAVGDERHACRRPWHWRRALSYIGCGTAVDGVFAGRLIRPAYFMPLRAENETGPDDEDEEEPKDDGLRAVPAPWAGLFDRRRPRIGWQRFSHALTFYAWLRGLKIRYRRGAEQQLVYGIQPPDGPCCWLGPHEWLVRQGEDREIGWRLWRAFLDAGGPWPTDFRLLASPSGGLKVRDGTESYARQGARCQHLWELTEQRERPGWL